MDGEFGCLGPAMRQSTEEEEDMHSNNTAYTKNKLGILPYGCVTKERNLPVICAIYLCHLDFSVNSAFLPSYDWLETSPTITYNQFQTKSVKEFTE